MDIKTKIRVEDYVKYVKKESPKSKTLVECVRAFIVGGLICVLGQAINAFASGVLKFNKDYASAFTSIFLIFLGAFFTGLGVYDVLGRFAGAGSIVPITGFANSMVAPALEFKREGYILGVGAKLFNIAGPVLVYGICASIVAGVFYLIFGA